jgi:hypothetical protein
LEAKSVSNKTVVAAVGCGLLVAQALGAQELVLPQSRNAFYADERVEIAVAGLNRGATATIELAPEASSVAPLRFDVSGDGSTATLVLFPYTLAPARYTLRLNGRDSGALTVASGVNRSTMLLSQTGMPLSELREAGANFVVGNAFSFGLLGPDSSVLKDLRGRSPGMQVFENAIEQNLPTLVYMYWTGYPTHKPWGANKSWAAADMGETMRLFNLHTAQRLRRYERNILSVGTLDEPGLAWGRTPTGQTTSGIASWDEAPWYQARGWTFTDDPGSRPDADWMRYMTIRTSILKENNAQAKADLRSVWPRVVFSTDFYAPQAITDGTEPLNQEVNDIPATHVFPDVGMGKLGLIGAIGLEKAHNPAAKVAHATNGQLFGEPVVQPQQRDAYRLMLGSMLAAGLHSNWWLNTTGMDKADLAAVNEPGLRMGPLFRGFAPAGHDVAVLWSFTEAAMRQKAVVAREAHRTAADSAMRTKGGVVVDAYSVGGNYREQVLAAHGALGRAGYPAHIVHERNLPRGALLGRKTLLVVGQTFTLPPDVRRAIADFQAAGGTVVVDSTTTAQFPGAQVTAANFRHPGFRWLAPFNANSQSFVNAREASRSKTNFFMDEQVRAAVPLLQKTMRQTGSRPVFVGGSVHLGTERHSGGEGSLLLLLNGYEELPDMGENEKYPIYNYGPHTATYTLQGVAPESAVYLIEGSEWRVVSRVANPTAPQTGRFAPGETKLYLVAPRVPYGLDVAARWEDGKLAIAASLKNLRMPWPLTLTIRDGEGAELYRVYRATDANGRFAEAFPLGSNTPAGIYSVTAESPVAGLSARVPVDVRPTRAAPRLLKDNVRVFDEQAIRRFFAQKPEVVIAIGSQVHQASAQQIATALGARGIRTRVLPEGEIIRKARYPRVWDPYIRVHRPTGEERKLDGMTVLRSLTAETGEDAANGDWKQPGTLVTVGKGGLVDFEAEQFYEPGVKLYVGDKGQVIVIKGEPVEVKSTEEVRQKWSRPWARLTRYEGSDRLPPQLPEAYQVDSHLILLGDSETSELVAALQASELLLQVADARYPGPGKALLNFAWSPFALGKNAILIGASDVAGIAAGIARLVNLAP